MKVSCLLPTYNKFANDRFGDCTHLVEESIESYRKQDFEDKELILCNDCAGQEYAYPHCSQDNVTIINLPKRFRSLGEKLNFMAGVATGDALLRWDDDDIYLPWRISVQVSHLTSHDYVTASSAWWRDTGRYSFRIGSGFSQVAFTRELFVRLRGFAFMGVGEDQDFEQRAVDLVPKDRFKSILVNKESAFSIYRWGTGSEHVSGYGPKGYELMGKTPVRPGFKTLNPHWQRDYLSDIKALRNVS